MWCAGKPRFVGINKKGVRRVRRKFPQLVTGIFRATAVRFCLPFSASGVIHCAR